MLVVPIRIPKHWLDEARAAIKAAPDSLTAGGWSLNRRAVPLGYDAKLDALQVATALAYLKMGPVRVLRRVPSRLPRSSYGMKHEAERWGREIGFAPYVTNGALIAAALHLRIPMRYVDRPNCALGVRTITR